MLLESKKKGHKMKRNILKRRRRLKGSVIKENWRRKNEGKKVKKNLTTLTSFM
jgi:hypothetical protein